VTKRLEDLYRSLRWISGLSVGILAIIVSTQPAAYNDGLTLSAVFLSLFFITAGFVAWLGYTLRRKNELTTGYPYILRTSLRQGIIAGATVVALLLLQLLRVMVAIDIVFIVLLAAVIELYLGARKATA